MCIALLSPSEMIGNGASQSFPATTCSDAMLLLCIMLFCAHISLHIISAKNSIAFFFLILLLYVVYELRDKVSIINLLCWLKF